MRAQEVDEKDHDKIKKTVSSPDKKFNKKAGSHELNRSGNQQSPQERNYKGA